MSESDYAAHVSKPWTKQVVQRLDENETGLYNANRLRLWHELGHELESATLHSYIAIRS